MITFASADWERIREAGDSALLLEVRATQESPLRAIIDESLNARAIRIAAAVRRREILGVRDVVSTVHSVAASLQLMILSCC